VLFGQYVKGPYNLISYNLNYCVEPSNVVEHINQGVVAVGPIFHPSGRTIVQNDSLGRPFIIFLIANL
jgi:hypothetical protein